MSHSLDLYATIHPPVQGENCLAYSGWISPHDTPSRTARKRNDIALYIQNWRYTLPYSEEILSVYAGFNPPKHLVVQIAQIVFFHY